ncbi:MAG: xanthine dehydrogenase accessory protein XdhC, partial [Gammaproteobacteria bacterium]|nr:xanthine dehydrogenase accessory protein XdhC [Gammaproteobacteria bacterium]
MRTWSVVAEMVASYGRCAMVTVADIRGSAPREPGARMVIAPDGGFRGTIGGGELEWQALGAARDMLSGDAAAASLERLTLGPDLGQCCGGSVRLLTEVFDRDRLD